MNVRLEQWVSDQHLSAAEIARCRQDIHQSEGRAAVIDNLLLPDKLAGLQNLFAGDGRFEPTWGLFSREPHEVSGPEFDAAPDQERFYQYLNLRGPAAGRAMAAGMLHNALFTLLTRSAGWRSWLADILGEPLARQTGMHARIMGRGMFMRSHGDGAHGSLCAVFYVAPGWQPSFGSCFRQTDGDKVVIEVAPLANRLLLFSPRNGLSHGVAPILAAAGDWQRWSYSLWYDGEG